MEWPAERLALYLIAAGDLEVIADGREFLSAVGGHPMTSAVARATADQRLLELSALGSNPRPWEDG